MSQPISICFLFFFLFPYAENKTTVDPCAGLYWDDKQANLPVAMVATISSLAFMYRLKSS